MAMLREKNANKTCFKSIVYKRNKYKTLEIKPNYHYKEQSTAEGPLWWQEIQRPEQKDVQRKLSLQSFGGKPVSTVLPVPGHISKITVWQNSQFKGFMTLKRE